MNEKKFFELVKNLVADYTNEHLDLHTTSFEKRSRPRR